MDKLHDILSPFVVSHPMIAILVSIAIGIGIGAAIFRKKKKD